MSSAFAEIRAIPWGRRVGAIILLAPLAILLASAVTGSSDYLTLMVIAGLVFLTVLTDIRIALLLIALCSYFLAYTIWLFDLPGPLINLGYFLILMVLVREIFFSTTRGFIPTPINYSLIALFLLGLLSMTMSDSAIYPAFKGLLRHVGFPLVFILILFAQPDEKFLRKLVIGIIIVAFIQVVASVIQYTWYTVGASKPPGMRADYSGGLLGFSCGGYTAIFLPMVYCILLGFMLVKGVRWYLLLGSALLLAPIYLASARAGVLFFIIATLFMLLVAPLDRHAAFFKRLYATGLLLIIFIILAFAGVGGSSFQALLNPDYIYEYSSKQADAGMGRLQAFEVIKEQLASPAARLMGLGPGMLTPTSVVDNPNSLIAQNPTLFRHVTGYANTVIELGYGGLVLFLLLYLQVYRFNRRFLRLAQDPFWESVSLGFCGAIVIYAISTVYVDSWIFYPLPFTFWALAAALYRVHLLQSSNPT